MVLYELLSRSLQRHSRGGNQPIRPLCHLRPSRGPSACGLSLTAPPQHLERDSLGNRPELQSRPIPRRATSLDRKPDTQAERDHNSDDASSDDSRAVIERVTSSLDIPVTTSFKQHSVWKCFKQWRKGLSLASGDLIWICESDDFSDEAFLGHIIRSFNDPSVNLAFGRIQFADEVGELNPWLDEYREQAEPNGWSAPRVEHAYEWFRGAFGYANVIPNVGGCVFRRQDFSAKVWQEAERYSVCGDWYLYMHIANAGRIAYEPEAISFFRQHGANTSVASFRRMKYYCLITTELRESFGVCTTSAMMGFGASTSVYENTSFDFFLRRRPLDYIACFRSKGSWRSEDRFVTSRSGYSAFPPAGRRSSLFTSLTNWLSAGSTCR